MAVVVAAVYVGVYLTLSANGQYMPGGYGIDGPKSYIWEPYGFVENPDGEFSVNAVNRVVRIAFLPLYLVDRQYWHPDALRSPTWPR